MLLHKPYGVLSQFTPEPGSRWGCLAELVPVPGVYAAGRLDADSEGLLLLTSNGRLQHRLTDPRWGHWRRYWAQVEGIPSDLALEPLRQGIQLKDGLSRPARVQQLPPQQRDGIAPRQPPIRERRNIPTTWLELELQEGRNRQVRRMTAAIGFPTLNLHLGSTVRPELGVYAVRVGILEGGETVWHDGVANIGKRPTFGGEDVILEAHIMNFSGDLYGKLIAVTLIDFIRAEKKFDGLEALRAQIAADTKTAQNILAEAPA